MRTAEKIIAEIDELKEKRFIEEMADFMNWQVYRELTKQIKELEAELEALKSKTIYERVRELQAERYAWQKEV